MAEKIASAILVYRALGRGEGSAFLLAFAHVRIRIACPRRANIFARNTDTSLSDVYLHTKGANKEATPGSLGSQK